MQKRRLLLIGAAAALTVVALTIAFLLGTFTRYGEAQSPAAGNEAPAIADPLLARIAVAGDTGTGDATARATAEQMTTQADRADPYDGLLLLGDRYCPAIRARVRSTNHPSTRHRASRCAMRGSGHHPAHVRSVASVMVNKSDVVTRRYPAGMQSASEIADQPDSRLGRDDAKKGSR